MTLLDTVKHCLKSKFEIHSIQVAGIVKILHFLYCRVKPLSFDWTFYYMAYFVQKTCDFQLNTIFYYVQVTFMLSWKLFLIFLRTFLLKYIHQRLHKCMKNADKPTENYFNIIIFMWFNSITSSDHIIFH